MFEQKWPFSSDLAKRISEDQDGKERKKILGLLEQWQKETVEFSGIKSEQRSALEDVIRLAIKMIHYVAPSTDIKK